MSSPHASPSAVVAGQETLRRLGWPTLLDALAASASTSRGALLATKLPPLSSLATIESRLGAVAELKALGEQGEFPPLSGCPDVEEALDRVRLGAALGSLQLREVALMAQIGLDCGDFLVRHLECLPKLGVQLRLEGGYRPLVKRITQAIDAQGVIQDNASPALGEARRRLRGLHGAARTRAQALLDDPAWAPYLMERFVSVRGERYVLPVKVAHRAQLPGRVHNISASSQTAFMEPSELSDLSDALAMARADEEAAEKAVLADLSATVGHFSETLRDDLVSLDALDLLNAAARLALKVRGAIPQLIDLPGDQLLLRGLRHPLLSLQPSTVIPNRLELACGQGLLVTGANAGGKTLAVTAAALCVLMVRHGLLPPLDPDSRLPLFSNVAVVLGDEQDLAEGLSSFSAHLQALAQLLPSAGPGSLVVIDEIASGTDPQEGAALAVALLEHLQAAGTTVLVTTHLAKLRALGAADDRFRLAAMERNQEGAPTYRLIADSAGRSGAIEAAARAGLPEALITRAQTLLEGDGGPLAESLESLEHATQEARAASAAAQKARADAELERERLARARQDLMEEKQALRLEARHALIADIEAARAEVKSRIAELQAEGSLKRAGALARHLETLEAKERAHVARKDTPTAQPQRLPETGDRVRAPAFGRGVGTVLSLEGAFATVQLGALRTRLDRSLLICVDPDAKGQGSRKDTRKGPAKWQRTSDRDSGDGASAGYEDTLAPTTIDLRGQHVEEAVGKLEQHLDRLYSAGEERARVIHGHGTGVLKRAVRTYLRDAPHVSAFEAEDPRLGGDGVTLVTF